MCELHEILSLKTTQPHSVCMCVNAHVYEWMNANGYSDTTSKKFRMTRRPSELLWLLNYKSCVILKFGIGFTHGYLEFAHLKIWNRWHNRMSIHIPKIMSLWQVILYLLYSIYPCTYEPHVSNISRL